MILEMSKIVPKEQPITFTTTPTTFLNEENSSEDEDLDIVDVVGNTLNGKEYQRRLEHRSGCVEFGRLVKLYSKK